MGLQDISLRLTDVEAATDFIKRWVGKNDDLIESALSLSDRVKALEGADIDNYVPVLKSYANLFGNDGIGFLFFTDPHNFSDNIKYYQLLDELRKIGKLFSNSAARFVLCGGDMINTDHTLADAKYYLGRVPNLLKKEIGQNTYIAPGNHDLNVHLPIDGTLTEPELARIWFGRDIGYSSFVDGNTRCFIFDSGRMSPAMTEYRWAQVDWFAKELLSNEADHVMGLIHIIGDNNGMAELSGNILAVADAFNTRQSITLNSITYNFAQAHGTFHFMLAGHNHIDNTDVVNGIPVLYTKDMMSCDMCFADYTEHVLKTIRYPTSEASRTIQIVYTGEPDNALPIWGITCSGTLNDVNRSQLATENQYTTIDSVNYTGRIDITATNPTSQYAWNNYRNGYISLCVSGLVSGKSYRMTADCVIRGNPLSNDQVLIGSRTGNMDRDGTTATIIDGKIDTTFTVYSDNANMQVMIRVGGKSLTISNINFEEVSSS